MKFFRSCCGTAKQQLEYTCTYHGDECPDQVLRYYPREDKGEKFSLLAANASYTAIFCPWCGKKLEDYCIPETIIIKDEN